MLVVGHAAEVHGIAQTIDRAVGHHYVQPFWILMVGMANEYIIIASILRLIPFYPSGQHFWVGKHVAQRRGGEAEETLAVGAAALAVVQVCYFTIRV